MSLPNDKDFELAVDKAIDEIFGKVESPKKELEVVEDESLKTPVELEPLELESPKEEGKVIDFPNLDEVIEPGIEIDTPQEEGLHQKDLEKLAAALLGLEWEVTPETSFEFLTALEEAREKAPSHLHPIFDLLHEVGSWLKDRAHEARPEWLHFLHQGIVALNLIVVHGKESEPYYHHLKKGLEGLKKASSPQTPEEKLHQNLINQLVQNYQRFLILKWLFSRSSKMKAWQIICQRALKEISETLEALPKEERPDLSKIKEKTFAKLKKHPISPTARPSTSATASSKKDLPFKEAYQVFIDEKEFLVPAEQVAYLGPFKSKWFNQINGGFPLKLLLGFWVYFSFVKLKNKLRGSLANKEEKELRNLVLPLLKKSTSPKVILILWEEERGGVILAEEALPFSIPEDAYFVSKKGGGSFFIKEQEFPILKV